MRGNLATWPHAPITSVIRGLSSPNGSTNWHILWDVHIGAGFCDRKRLELGSFFHRCNMASL
jgi:hypothetical protein